MVNLNPSLQRSVHLGRYSEEIVNTANELKSVSLALNVLHGYPDRPGCYAHGTGKNDRYKYSYAASPNEEKLKFEFERKERPLSLSRMLKRVLEWDATFTIDTESGQLCNANKKVGFGDYDFVTTWKDKRLSPRQVATILKSILKYEKEKLKNPDLSKVKFTLEEYFALSLAEKLLPETPRSDPEKTLQTALDLYANHQDIFKHSDSIGLWLKAGAENLITKTEEVLPRAKDQLAKVNEERESNWLHKTVNELNDNLLGVVFNVCRLAGDKCEKDVLFSVGEGDDRIFGASVIVQDRMYKFETVEVLGRWDGQCLDALIFDDGLIKYWRNDKMEGLDPRLVMDACYQSLVFGGVLVPVSETIAEFKAYEDLKAINLMTKDIKSPEIRRVIDLLVQFGVDYERVCNKVLPEENEAARFFTDFNLGYPPKLNCKASPS